MLLVILFAHWEPRADFDVTGVLWLMQNILPLTIVCILFVLASGALAQLLVLIYFPKASPPRKFSRR